MSLTTNKMFYVSWEAFHRATKELAKGLLNRDFDSIVAVSRGGLVPAAILARELEINYACCAVVANWALRTALPWSCTWTASGSSMAT